MSCKSVIFLCLISLVDFYKSEYIFEVKYQQIEAHFDHILEWERNLPESNIDARIKCTFDPVKQKLQIWKKEMETNDLLFDNPLTNFLYIKMRLIDFMLFRKKNKNAKKSTKYIPTKEDLTKSVLLINEFMENEELSVADFVAKFEAKYENVIFSSSDCLVIAHELYKEEFIYLASDWFVLAENKMSVENCIVDEELFWKLKHKIYEDEDVHEDHKFKQLCKNIETVSNPISFRNGSLFCKISPLKNNPLLPQKIEVLSSEPIIEVYHDFLDEQEIEKLLDVATNYKFEKAGEMMENGTSQYDGEARVAEEMFMNEDEPYALTIMEKMEFATGLSMEHAEDLQIIKYRPGGLFSPHRDYYEDEQLEDSEFGNRIALGMIFLNKRNLHAGCKVFIGNKIAAVSGTHELDQNRICQVRRQNL